MKEYRVRFEIDLDAESPEEAARIAADWMLDPVLKLAVLHRKLLDGDWIILEIDGERCATVVRHRSGGLAQCALDRGHRGRHLIDRQEQAAMDAIVDATGRTPPGPDPTVLEST